MPQYVSENKNVECLLVDKNVLNDDSEAVNSGTVKKRLRLRLLKKDMDRRRRRIFTHLYINNCESVFVYYPQFQNIKQKVF